MNTSNGSKIAANGRYFFLNFNLTSQVINEMINIFFQIIPLSSQGRCVQGIPVLHAPAIQDYNNLISQSPI